MGYRARRRLAWAGGIAVLAVALTVVAAIRRHSSSGVQPASSRQQVGMLGALGIEYGEPARQVLRKLGPSASKRGGCWVYRTHATLHQDAVEFCFGGGAVTDIEVHHPAFVWHRKHVPAGWAPPLVAEPHPSQPVE
jgi:hypothetical protein